VAQKAAKGDEEKPRETSFWDTLWGMLYLVASILFLRWKIWEPFKIPSGSMEPTLFGHDDYGDRIVTNKLAYAGAGEVWFVIAVLAVLIVLAFIAWKAWRHWHGRIIMALIAVLALGGVFFAWSRDAVAGMPQRFDVVVFQYNRAWEHTGDPDKDINYIKRLIGLPGDQIVISGGDLFLRKKDNDEILRKWNLRPEMQATVWYPVSRAWSPLVHERPKPDDPNHAEIEREIETLRFPWTGAQPGTPGAALGRKSLYLDGSAPVTLTYAFPVTNIYLKQGRWPFRHVKCPAAHLEGVKSESGVVFSNPASTTENMTAYVTNTWEGVECPNCKEIMFPLSPVKPEIGPWLADRSSFDDGRPAKFFYGGDYVVGDLKLDIVLDVEVPGKMELEVGSNLHRALWRIPAAAESNQPQPGAHEVRVSGAAPQLSPGKHALSLAYVDATIIARFDGRQIDCQEIEVAPLGRAAAEIKSVARLSFSGLKGTLTRLELSRDLYYPSMIGAKARDPRELERGVTKRARDGGSGIDEETGNYISRKLHESEYWMMGDNSPSSSDSRVWGVVPKDRLVGRASFVWWPPSRWRFIK